MTKFSTDKLILALDSPDNEFNEKLTVALNHLVSFYKIGLGTFSFGGNHLLQKLKGENKKVFLDLKLFDIGTTVEKSVKKLSSYGVDFLTVHGDPNVIKGALEGRVGNTTKILAVTFLTNLDRGDLNKALIKSGKLTDLVLERAQNAFLSGADGVIASPLEAKLIRKLPESANKLIVTPGIRLLGENLNDQKRVSTPGEAIKMGANYIVVGRPIWASQNPILSTEHILQNIDEASQTKEI